MGSKRLQRQARERQGRTGERYTTALARVREFANARTADDLRCPDCRSQRIRLAAFHRTKAILVFDGGHVEVLDPLAEEQHRGIFCACGECGARFTPTRAVTESLWVLVDGALVDFAEDG